MTSEPTNEPGKDDSEAQPKASGESLESQSSQTLLDQSELDAVMALVAKQRAEAKAKKKAIESQLASPPPPAPPVSVTQVNLGPIAQSELDSVLAGRPEPGAASVESPEAAPAAPAVTPERLSVEQKAADTPAPAPVQPAPPRAAPPARPVGQNEIDALMRGEIDRLLATTEPSGSIQEVPADSQDTTVDQDEVDRLLAAMSSQGSTPAAQPPSPAPPAAPPSAEETSGTLGQDEIDRLLASAQNLERRDSDFAQKAHDKAEANREKSKPTDAAPFAGGTLSQEEIDNLLRADATDVPLDHSDMDAPIDTAGIVTSDSMDTVIGPKPDETVLAQDDVDALLSQAGTSRTEESDQDETILVDPVDRALRSNAMESVSLENLAAAAPSSKEAEDAVLSQDLIDSLLAQATQAAPSSPSAAATEPAQADREVSALDELGIPSSDELTTHPVVETSVVEPAGAVHLSESDVADLGYPPAATAAAAVEVGVPQERADKVEETKDTGVVARLRITRAPWPRPGLKEWTAIAAGVTLAAASFFYFSSKLEPVPVETAQHGTETSQATQEAQAHTEEPGAPEAAAPKTEIAPQVAEVPADAHRPREPIAAAAGPHEAKYKEIENAYLELAKSPAESEADAIQEEIDTLVALAPNDPRAPELLRWKAELYERTNLPMAALDVYKQILDQYSATAGQDKTLLAMGHVYMGIKRSEQAAGVLQELMDKYPGSALLQEARLLMGDAQLMLGKRDEARRLYTQVAMGDPNSYLGSVAYGKLGEMELDDGRYGEAIKLLEARLEVATSTEGHEHIYMTLARAYRNSGKLSEAEKTLRELIDFFPDSDLTPKAYIELSQVLDQAGRRPEALRVATYAKSRFPEEGELLRNYSAMQSLVGDERAAAQGLVQGIRAGDRTPGILLSAARSLGKVGDFEEARFNLEQLTSIYPTSPEAFDGQILLAELLYKNGDATKALESLDEMEQLYARKPQRLPIYTTRGSIYRDLGLAEKAAEDYEKAAELTTESAVLAESAEALFDAKRYSSGFAAASRVDTDKLSDETAYAFLVDYGQALMNGRREIAVDKLENAANKYPELRTREGDLALLDAYTETGREASARVLLANIESRARRDESKLGDLQEAALLLGEHFFLKGDYRAAAETYELATDPRVPDSAEDVAWAKYQQGNAWLLANSPRQSLALFKEVGASESRWSEDAKLKAQFIELSLKLRLPISLASAARAVPERTPPGTESSSPPRTEQPVDEIPAPGQAATAAGG